MEEINGLRCGCVVGGGREAPLSVCNRPAVAVTFTARDSYARCRLHVGRIAGRTIDVAVPADVAR